MHFTSSIAAAILTATAVRADFYFGAGTGSTQVGVGGTPAQQKTYHEFIIIGNEDICDADSYPGDPGPEDLDSQDGSGPWIDWCGNVKVDDADLELKGPCGSDVRGDDGSDKLADKHYADIYDNNDDGKKVGECYFESSDTHWCGDGIGSQERSYSIHCETDALGDPKE